VGGGSSSRFSIGRGHPGFHSRTAPKIERTQSTASLGLKFEHRPARKTGNAGGRSTGSRKHQHSSSRCSLGGSTVSQLPATKRRHIDEQGQSVGGPLQGVNAKQENQVKLEAEDEEEEKEKMIFKKEPED
jgi:hypothetical protein